MLAHDGQDHVANHIPTHVFHGGRKILGRSINDGTILESRREDL